MRGDGRLSCRFFCAFSLLFLFEKVANSGYLCIFADEILMIIGL